MKLTNEHKLIVAMLANLAKPSDERDLDFDFIDKVVTDGHEWAIEWKYPGLFGASSDASAEVNFVAEVLNMWEHIEESYAKLDRADRGKVDASGYPEGPRFIGFDGNNEGYLMGVVSTLINTLGAFPAFAGRSRLNSHSPRKEYYERMLSVFRAEVSQNHSAQLNAEQLIRVLSPPHV